DESSRSRWRRRRRSACRGGGLHRAWHRAWEYRSRRAQSRRAILHDASLRPELCFVEIAQLGERRGLARGLVVADAAGAGEAEGQPRRIGRTLLDLVVFDLDHDLGRHPYGVAVVVEGERLQSLGHRTELLVGEALERLADVRPTVAVAHRQVIVGQPADAAA